MVSCIQKEGVAKPSLDDEQGQKYVIKSVLYLAKFARYSAEFATTSKTRHTSDHCKTAFFDPNPIDGPS
jgi:hypothetical protein